MKKFLLLLSFFIGFTLNVDSQTILYQEDFSSNEGKGQNQTSLDTAGVTNWTIVPSGVPAAVNWNHHTRYFKVMNGYFERSGNLGGPNSKIFWYSKTINCSGLPNVSVSVDLGRTGANSNTGIEAFYAIYDAGDWGEWISFGSKIGNSGETDFETFSETGLSGDSIQIRIDNWGGWSNDYRRHDNVKIEYTEDIALPVTLTSFTAGCDGSIPLLKWTTASEQNSYYFGIERSRDGFEWIEVSQVPAAGNSSTVKNYQFYDMNAGRFEGYYRLKQVDFDGQFEYFSPKYSNCIKEKINKIDLYPNPTEDELFIKVDNQSIEINTDMIILDNLGRIVDKIEIQIKPGYNFYKIDVSKYPTAIYNIKILGFMYENKRFIKK